ncbi:SMP-30/gluconolactonase/LRE family protein [Swingsia samuiensis]|uniref:SMP-30/gluconolactonase/LRE family protein n=1 Tax=Swingsia samuiensis TaxID=1293412 RepID=A0A4Y6UMD3_9PROT|nr:SMP-30/gluconolactonase/LRE family protein [Swingsia samuiensis]QDH17507.1 SMP-30/gluconolactonase/LRE family protein [Swingsia samuiensis]
MTLKYHNPECVLDVRATLGEGPVWIGSESALYFVDILGKKVHRFVPDTAEHKSWDAPARVGFMLPVEDGKFLAGLADGLHIFDPHTGEFAPHAQIEPEHPGNRLNDGCVDGLGRLWFGTMDDGEENETGSIYRVIHKRDGLEITKHDEGYVVSNGPAVSPNGDVLYVCDSGEQKVYAFDLDKAGNLSNERLFAQFSDGYPDGVVTDSEGNVWCGTWGGGRVSRFRPDGTPLPSIEMPATNVTKIAFGGDDLKTVFVTTARKGLDAETLAKEPQAGSIFAFRTDVAGNPQHAFRLEK